MSRSFSLSLTAAFSAMSLPVFASTNANDSLPGLAVLLAGIAVLFTVALVFLVLWGLARKALGVQAQELDEVGVKLAEAEKSRRASHDDLVASRDAMARLEGELGDLVAAKSIAEGEFSAEIDELKQELLGLKHEASELNLDMDNLRDQLRINQGMLDEQFAETGRMAGLLEIADEEAEELQRQHEEVLAIRAAHVAQGVNNLVGLAFYAVDGGPETPVQNLDAMKQEALSLVSDDMPVLAQTLKGARVALLLDDALEGRMIRGYLEPSITVLSADSNELLALLDADSLDGIIMDGSLSQARSLKAFGKAGVAVISLGDEAGQLPKPLKIAALFKALAAQLTVSEQRQIQTIELEPQDPIIIKLPGVDTEAGLAAYQADAEVYRQALLDFQSDAQGYLATLLEAAKAEAWVAMEAASQMLADQAYKLGATMLAKTAENVAKARGEGLELAPLLPPLQASVTFFCHSIQGLNKPVAEVAQAARIRSVDPFVLQPRLNDLALLLEVRNAEAEACLETIYELYKETEVQPDLYAIKDKLSEADYPSALRLLKALNEHLADFA